MKLKAKILPKYFEQIKEGVKKIDYRQMETFTFVNTETGAEIELEIRDIKRLPSWENISLVKAFPDVGFTENSKICKIILGKIIKPEEFQNANK